MKTTEINSGRQKHMYKQSSRHQVDEIRLSASFVDRAKSRSYGWLTCCCSVNIQVVCKVLKIRELSSHNIHDVTQESLFSVCRASILELQISNKRLTKQLNSTGESCDFAVWFSSSIAQYCNCHNQIYSNQNTKNTNQK